jgi:hypothetical protein
MSKRRCANDAARGGRRVDARRCSRARGVVGGVGWEIELRRCRWGAGSRRRIARIQSRTRGRDVVGESIGRARRGEAASIPYSDPLTGAIEDGERNRKKTEDDRCESDEDTLLSKRAASLGARNFGIGGRSLRHFSIGDRDDGAHTFGASVVMTFLYVVARSRRAVARGSGFVVVRHGQRRPSAPTVAQALDKAGQSR